MTTLAQRMIENGDCVPKYGGESHRKTGQLALELLRSRLGVFPASKVLGDDLVEDWQRKATRFVFTEDAPTEIVKQIKAGAIDELVVFRSLEFPGDVTWIEWPARFKETPDGKLNDPGTLAGMGRVGIMIDPHILSGNRVLFSICAGMDGEDGALFALAELPAVDGRLVTNGEGFPTASVHWICDANYDEQSKRYCARLIRECLMAVFAITTPRLCEVRDVTWDHKLQKSRAKKGRHPLIEYTQVKLAIGGTRVRYKHSGEATTEEDEISHRRLHQVIGHFRTLSAGRAQPRVSWVPPHWRGDAALGVLLHDRLVTASKEDTK